MSLSATLVFKGFDDSVSPALLFVTYTSLLAWYYSGYAALLGRCLISLASPMYRGL